MLNDRMTDDMRNELLMPFVLRLAGADDGPQVERKRMRFIVVECVRRIHSYVYRHILWDPEAAAQCEKVVLLCQAWWVAKRITKGFSHRCMIGAHSAAHATYSAHVTYAHNAEAAYKKGDLVSDACAGNTYAMTLMNAAICSVTFAAAGRAGARAQRAIFTMATNILDEAIKTGNDSEALTSEEMTIEAPSENPV